MPSFGDAELSMNKSYDRRKQYLGNDRPKSDQVFTSSLAGPCILGLLKVPDPGLRCLQQCDRIKPGLEGPISFDVRNQTCDSQQSIHPKWKAK